MPASCNFYILSSARENGRFLFCCALIEKLYMHGHRVYVHCQNDAEASRFSELLWTYKDISFIPHSLSGECSIEDCPVEIGFNDPSKDYQDVLILLSVLPTIPNFYSQFSRIVEIVDENPTVKEILREHYQQYRTQGLEVKTHRI